MSLPGSMDQRPSGHWRVRVKLANGERISHHFATEEEAVRFRRGLAALEATKPTLATGPQTLETFAPKWLQEREESGIPSYKNDVSNWRVHLSKAPFVATPLASISRVQVKDWLEALRRTKARSSSAWKKADEYTAPLSEKYLSRSSIGHALKLLRCVLDAAIEEGLLRENVAKGLKLPKSRSTEEEWTFLRADEMQAILSCPRVTDDERDMLLFAWHTGLRTGELFGLHREDAVLDGPHPHIVVRYSWRGPTKTGEVRTVPLLPAARDALERYLSRHRKASYDPVFATVTGCPQRVSYDGGWGDRLGKDGERKLGIKSRAGIERRITFYSATRHTCASHLLMGTWGKPWTLAEVGALLGHSDAEVTQRYAHVCGVHLAGRAAETPGLSWDHKKEPVCGPDSSQGNAKSRSESRGAGDRDRTGDVQLGKRNVSPLIPIGSTAWDHGRTTALSLLAAVAAREPAGDLVDALVASVLSDERVQLALAVQSAEPRFRLRRALELAALVLDEAEAEGQRGVK